MSVISKNIPFSRRKEEKLEQEKKHTEKTGIIINGNPEMDNSGRKSMLLANALLNFLTCFGTLGCFVSPFEIKANMPVIAIAAIFIALITAFLYYNTFIKTVGYLVLFSGFIFSVLKLRYMLKGGFGYVCNRMMEFLERNFALPLERSYDVYNYSEELSVTVVFIFILFAIMLLFNMAISESKGFMMILMFTFPIVQMGMYFDKNINVFYFGIYVIAILGLFLIRTSEHFRMETKKKRGYLKKEKKNRIEYDYVADGKYSLSFVVSLSILVLVFILVAGVIYPQNKFKMTTQFNEWKEGTRDFTEKLALVGFWGMLNPEGAAGGVGRSRLGQSKYVKLDYQTDMEVQLLYDTEEQSVYLKSFNGTFYRDEFWETISENKDNDIKPADYGLEEEDIKNLTLELYDIYDFWFLGSYKYMKVSNIGANSAFYYYPYYSAISDKVRLQENADDEIIGGLNRNYSMYVGYSPLIYSFDSVKDVKQEVYEIRAEVNEIINEENDEEVNRIIENEKKYSEYVKDIYLDVPKENIEAIKAFCEEYGIDKDSEYIVEEVMQVFNDEYEYTLMPGRTPKNKEFINYFLSESQKGYCTYFASSAVLIYRYLGIPARYCGGYVLRQDELEGSGKQIQLSYNGEDYSAEEDWIISGEVSTYRNTKGVCEYEIDDSMAHAWLEIYIDGFGWYPVDVTPPDYNDDYDFDDDDSNILGFLSNNVITRENIKVIRKASRSVVYVVGVFAGLFVLGYIVTGIIVRYIRKGCRPVNKKYLYLCRCAKYIGIKKSDSRTYEEFANLLSTKEVIEEDIIHEVIRIIEKNKFSAKGISREEERYVSDKINEAAVNIYSQIKWYKKFIYRFINWL